MKCWCCLENEVDKERDQCKPCEADYFRIKRLEETVLSKFSGHYELLEGKQATYTVNGKSYRINTYVKRNVKDTVKHIANCVLYVDGEKFTLTSMKIVTRKKYNWTDGTKSRKAHTVEEFQFPHEKGQPLNWIPAVTQLTRHKQDLLKEKILTIFDHYIEDYKGETVQA